MKPGTKLENGATVIAAKYVAGEWFILAVWPHEYVCWRSLKTDPLASTYWGKYYGTDLEAALTGWRERYEKHARIYERSAL